MNPTIKILLLASVAVVLVIGLLDQPESDTFSMDTLFTLAFIGYIWHKLRGNNNVNTPPSSPSKPSDTQKEETPFATKPVPPKLYVLPQVTKTASSRVIQHKPPWTIIEQGQSVGYFRHLPIPAWIRTSDNRQADYAGIALMPPPKECVCLELPDQAELILPPGLIYAIRS